MAHSFCIGTHIINLWKTFVNTLLLRPPRLQSQFCDNNQLGFVHSNNYIKIRDLKQTKSSLQYMTNVMC